MGDYLKKVQPGQTLDIPAAAYNAFIDAANDSRARRANQGGQAAERFFQNSIVSVQNTSGAAQNRFAILGIDSPIFTPTDNMDEFAGRFALKAVVPVAATHKGRFVILAGPAGVNDVTRGYVAGVCPVQINVTDATHTFAEVTDGSVANLTSGTTGSAVILWKEPGTGLKWAVVRIDNSGSALPPGTITAQMLYWDQTAKEWKLLAPPPLDGLMYVLTAQDGGTGVRTLVWVDGTECEGDQVDGGTY